MKLISEHFSDDVEYIKEEREDGKKSFKLKGVFMQAEIKNRNGRVYPMEVLEKEVARYNKEFIEQNRAYGELGHPDGPTVNLDKVSHMVTSLKPDGKTLSVRQKLCQHQWVRLYLISWMMVVNSQCPQGAWVV